MTKSNTKNKILTLELIMVIKLCLLIIMRMRKIQIKLVNKALKIMFLLA